MLPLIIKKREDTPAIIFNPQKNIFKIAGSSYCERPLEFYSPIFQWINEYFNNPNALTIFEFRFIYPNTSSDIQINKLFSLLNKKSKEYQIKINWCYEYNDNDILDMGKRMFERFELDFDYIELPHYKN